MLKGDTISVIFKDIIYRPICYIVLKSWLYNTFTEKIQLTNSHFSLPTLVRGCI